MLKQQLSRLPRWIVLSPLAVMLMSAVVTAQTGTYGPLRPTGATSAPATPAAPGSPLTPMSTTPGSPASRPTSQPGPVFSPASAPVQTRVPGATMQPQSMPGSRPASQPASMPMGMSLSPEARQAQRLYNEGLTALNSGDLIGARARLSSALSSGALPAELNTPCRNRLTEITQRVVFGPEVYPGDADAYYYTLKSGDVLVKVVKSEKLYVNDQAIQKINGIVNPTRIRAGQRIKLVRGPFDAIVTKGTYTLDLYHNGMFVKTYPIGLGQDGKTPVGKFMVKPGGRVPQAPWTSQVGKVIYFGQPGYPLGTKGFWIGLQSAEVGTQDLPGFGMHGTNEPDSIGRDASSGCIRLLDEDIDELFGLMYDGMSKVEVRP